MGSSFSGSHSIALFSASVLLLLLKFNLNAAQIYRHNFCYEEYAPNSQYDVNLDILLSSISNNTTGRNARFYNTTVGNSPDRVFGIFQCRGDVSSEDCSNCAKFAAKDIKVRCPTNKEISIWYDQCWLRYSNKIIISTMIGDPKMYKPGRNVSNPEDFRSTLNRLMIQLVARAINSTDKYAADEEKVTNSSQTIYGLVQCTGDISTRDCGRCLAKSVNQIPPCCDAKERGEILKPSCVLEFDVTKFYTSSLLPLDTGGKSKPLVIRIVAPTGTVLVFLSILTIFLYSRKKKKVEMAMSDIPTLESLQFNFATITTATENFKIANKLGEGGFGSVYKGALSDGRKIAVKRLSTSSSQGVQEFKNEVLLLAKLRHRNLVRLLGFCLEGIEKLLIYEYVPNSSLDKFIFDAIERTYLSWERRYNIILGIARGLLYLHEDSPDRIIHRDLKASNILLDEKMNPKISDFGLARLFVVDQTEGNTNRIVGTRGYMPPEYLMHGHFSVKLDVFSFGVLMLEIITGQKNTSFQLGESGQDLLSYAWRQWVEGSASDLIDPRLSETYSTNEVMKCIHMGLLCVQEDVSRRPTMASIVLMLNNYAFTLPTPFAPAFFAHSKMELNIVREDDGYDTAKQSQSSRYKSITGSVDDSLITEVQPR